MLDGTAAAMTGCPANAEADVMEIVQKSGGHVATERGLAGVIEIMDAIQNGTVNSKLPDWWVPNRLQKNPKSSRRNMSHTGGREPALSTGRHETRHLGRIYGACGLCQFRTDSIFGADSKTVYAGGEIG